MRAFDLTMTHLRLPEGDRSAVSAASIGQGGGTGDIFVTGSGSTPSEALADLARLFKENDEFPAEGGEED